MAKKKVTGEDGKTYVMKEKKPFYKKVWFWILVVIVVAGIGGALGSGNDENNAVKEANSSSNVADSNKQETKESTKANEAPKEEKVYKIGDKVPVGTVEYVINSKEVKDQVGGEYTAQNAKAKYLVLDVTITNNGDKAITIADDFFKLYKGKTEFKTDSSASIAANQESGSTGLDFFYQELNPESSLTGKVVFDVNEETINDPSTQIQVQTGVWGTETERINLN
ncbi:DUF4352 domain-containing protein [Enterococcus dispar]|uniref:DUF4352 domain-containing protein n=1 Tax=Enterococcus dispar ATCC 51266 TaxID=1139219 RepID=S1NGT1_9ENTE|nr:DUF4352 domain-containing protein [Enterococcus dispar]EOT42631.1 hypothetical protein OMK_00992 [Enterococcus dispar ATCC 51266]EOW84918.1 hypothetical protein I569_00207 [Enterococcus dispar ATCC 51266]